MISLRYTPETLFQSYTRYFAFPNSPELTQTRALAFVVVPFSLSCDLVRDGRLLPRTALAAGVPSRGPGRKGVFCFGAATALELEGGAKTVRCLNPKPLYALLQPKSIKP